MSKANNSSRQIAKIFATCFATLLVTAFVYSQAPNTWTQKADFPGIPRDWAVGFSIENKGYIGTGYTGNYKKDFWEYDPTIDTWAQKDYFKGTGRATAVGFSIGTKGYIGTGSALTTGPTKDFWEYDPDNDTWTQKADFGGTERSAAVGFSIGDKGYLGTGYSGTNEKDFWEYDPLTNSWTQKADFGGTARELAVGFSIGTKGYIGTGLNYPSYYNDFWEYNPDNDTWTQKADFGGTGRRSAVGFSIGNKGYIGTGYDGYIRKDFWEYDPDTNTWTQKADFGGEAKYQAVGFSIGGKGYIGTGTELFEFLTTDFWEYTPGIIACAVPSNLSVKNITASSAKLKWDGVDSAQSYKIRYKKSFTTEWTYEISYGNLKYISGLSPSTTYSWQVRSYCHLDTSHEKSDWSSKEKFTTLPFRVSGKSSEQVSFQIYPNPAENYAAIQFMLPQSSRVTVKVYDVSGKEMETLLNDELSKGKISLQLNTDHFAKGVYLVRMISDYGTITEKLIAQ